MQLKACPKQYTADQDKAVPPEATIRRVKQALKAFGAGILKQTRRIDTGRLGIPVYLSLCGSKAAEIMPSRKQMGKGASPEQAEASALMELVERFSLFSYFGTRQSTEALTWSEAEQQFGSSLLPVSEILHSTHEELKPDQATAILDLVPWQFCPALRVGDGQERHIPLNWFKLLNEYNGSAAGNTLEESLLQGACELFERHVCTAIERTRPVLPSIDPASFQDPVLKHLQDCFARNRITTLIKDFSLGTGLPTVGIMAYDPATFPRSSEIVFTAGSATSPEKAVIRAFTEIAQLAGDFETESRYEPSGLGKYQELDQGAWLQSGPVVPVDSLPDISDPDIHREVQTLALLLEKQGSALYAVDTTHPQLQIPATYALIPGFSFRERTPSACLGLFTGRILAEEASYPRAESGFALLDAIYPRNHFTPFFRGLLDLRHQHLDNAIRQFAQAEALQPTPEEQALVAFYQAHALTGKQDWSTACRHLDRAIALSPGSHAYHNLRGTARFKLKEYPQAAQDFQQAIDIDNGSAIDRANLGICYKHLGQNLKAIELLHTGLELDPGLDFARQALDELLH